MSNPKKLLSFSTKALEEEIRRRSLNKPITLPSEDLLWEKVIEFVEEEGIECLEKGHKLPKWFEKELLRKVLRTMFDGEIEEWWKLHKKRNA